MPSPAQRCFYSHSLTCLAAACLNTPVKQHILGTKQLVPAEPLLLHPTHFSCLAHPLISSRLVPGKHPRSGMWLMRAKGEDPQCLVRHRAVNAHCFLPFKPLTFYKLIHEPSLNKGTQSPWGKPASNTRAKCKYYIAGRQLVRGLNTRIPISLLLEPRDFLRVCAAAITESPWWEQVPSWALHSPKTSNNNSQPVCHVLFFW